MIILGKVSELEQGTTCAGRKCKEVVLRAYERTT